jgi:hypothetical protein
MNWEARAKELISTAPAKTVVADIHARRPFRDPHALALSEVQLTLMQDTALDLWRAIDEARERFRAVGLSEYLAVAYFLKTVPALFAQSLMDTYGGNFTDENMCEAMCAVDAHQVTVSELCRGLPRLQTYVALLSELHREYHERNPGRDH